MQILTYQFSPINRNQCYIPSFFKKVLECLIKGSSLEKAEADEHQEELLINTEEIKIEPPLDTDRITIIKLLSINRTRKKQIKKNNNCTEQL